MANMINTNTNKGVRHYVQGLRRMKLIIESNKERLLNSIMKKYDIKDNDFLDNDKINAILREINIDHILDDE